MRAAACDAWSTMAFSLARARSLFTRSWGSMIGLKSEDCTNIQCHSLDKTLYTTARSSSIFSMAACIRGDVSASDKSL